MITPQKRFPGSEVTLTAYFTDDSDVATDPTTVVLKTYDPYGQKKTYTYGTDANLTKVATGQYSATIEVDSAGRWHIRWEGDGVAVEEDNFIVTDSKFYEPLPIWDYR